MRYDAVFLDVDRTLLWVDVDIEGYVEDLAPYAENGCLTVEKARGPLLESLQKHINENINYPSEEELAEFKRENARETAESLSLDAPAAVLDETLERRLRFEPYPEFEETLRVAGVSRERAVHVGNDPVSDVQGASSCGIDAVLIDREGNLEAPEATVTLPDLRGLPAIVR